MNEILLIVWFVVVGACVGSFMNVVIYRVPRGKSIVSPPSHCPKCSHIIRSYDNIPIFGWFLLGGKCRDCKMPISFRYPLIETVSCAIVTTFAVLLLLPVDFAMEFTLDRVSVPILAKIAWLSVLHLYLLTLGMIDFDRQTLNSNLFLVPFLISGSVFLGFAVGIGAIVSMTIGFLLTKIIRVNDQDLWMSASLALGLFLGWQVAIVILLATLLCHAAITFVTQRSFAVLSLAIMSFVVNVWVLLFLPGANPYTNLLNWYIYHW